MRIENGYVFAMSADNQPAARVKNGERITFVTRDCFNNQFQDENVTLDALNWEAINPATGPVYIEGAMPGDVLKVQIETIELADCGAMCAIPGDGVLGGLFRKGKLKRIPVKDRMAYFNEEIVIPCNPMIGVIGVAPAEGRIPCGEPGNHGGNMDNTRICEGAALYLPVFHEGALFALGDVHACMGDGEIMVSGLEIPAEVTVTVEVMKGMTIENPMLEDKDSCYTIASDTDLEKAILAATRTMAEILMKKKGMSLEDAGMLLSAVGNLQFCQVVDPKRTVRMEVKKTVLEGLF